MQIGVTREKSTKLFEDFTEFVKDLKEEPPNIENQIWIDMLGDIEKEYLDCISYMFYLHELTEDDLLNSDSSAKWEVFDGYLFVILYANDKVENECCLSIVLGDYYMLSFHKDEIEAINDMEEDVDQYRK